MCEPQQSINRMLRLRGNPGYVHRKPARAIAMNVFSRHPLANHGSPTSEKDGNFTEGSRNTQSHQGIVSLLMEADVASNHRDSPQIC